MLTREDRLANLARGRQRRLDNLHAAKMQLKPEVQVQVAEPEPPPRDLTRAEQLLRDFIDTSMVWAAAGGTALPFCRLCEDALHHGDRPCSCPCHPAKEHLGVA